jgi:hypothetical protein
MIIGSHCLKPHDAGGFLSILLITQSAAMRDPQDFDPSFVCASQYSCLTPLATPGISSTR